ncbi:hypothetical protein CSC74_03160 [Pseudoxanthomonas yeongjuensis]|nr:hypothetical protein CSC74_03160 [Pseudoxanthomonas yeongjuensis]
MQFRSLSSHLVPQQVVQQIIVESAFYAVGWDIFSSGHQVDMNTTGVVFDFHEEIAGIAMSCPGNNFDWKHFPQYDA